jgi:hypothetical protein
VCITITANLAKTGWIGGISGVTGTSGLGDDVCPPGSSSTININSQMTLSGIKRLTCPLQINAGGTLTLAQGTQMVVSGSQIISVAGGALDIGASGQSNPVVITAQNASKSSWTGIRLTASAGVVSSVSINNATIKNADRGIEAYYASWDDPAHTFNLDRVTFDTCNNGIYDYCPPGSTNLTFLNNGTGVYEYYGCSGARVYDGFVFNGVGVGVEMRGGPLTVSNSHFTSVTTAAIEMTQNLGASLVVQNSVFDQPAFNASNYAVRVDTSACPDLRVTESVFRNWGTAITHANCSQPLIVPRFTVLGNVFEKNGTAIYDAGYSISQAEIHLNAFLPTTAGTDIKLWYKSYDANAQGNYFGPTNDATNAAGASLGVPAGVVPNAPRIYDYLDDSTNVDRMVRLDNLLPTAFTDPVAHPMAYIREPERTRAYNSNRCIPLVYDAPFGSVGACRWFLDGSATMATVDADSCLVGNLTDGEHPVRLDCDVVDAMNNLIRTDTHQASFLVKNDSFSGVQHRPVEHWMGTVLVDGDIIVPQGKTLVIDPGTTVSFAANDRLVHAALLDYSPDSINQFFGSRGLVDIYVRGLLQANGTVGSRIKLQSVSGLALASQWGNVNVDINASFQLSFADVIGANYLGDGRYLNNQPLSAPHIDFSNMTVNQIRMAARGVCPSTFSNISGQDITRNVIDGYCPQSLTLQNVSLVRVTDASGTQPAVHLYNYASGSPVVAVTMANVSLDHGYPGRNGIGVKIEPGTINIVSVQGSLLKSFDTAFYNYDGSSDNESFSISDSVIDNFNYAFGSFNYIEVFNADHNKFQNGQYIAWQGEIAKNPVFTRNRFTNVTTAFPNQTLASSPLTWQFTGNEVSGYTKVFSNLQVNNAPGTVSFDFSGNNYLGTNVTRASILDLNENYCVGCPDGAYCGNAGSATVQLNMTGSYFGQNAAGTLTKSDDETKIVLGWEGPTGAFTAPPSGRQVDYSNDQASPLTLDLLP